MNAFKGCLILFAVWSIRGFSQASGDEIPDPVTAQNHTYEALKAAFDDYAGDSATAALYANAYVRKGKKEHNVVRTAEGYDMLWALNKRNRTGLAYSDSIIELTKAIDDKVFPARGYLTKGFYYYTLGDYKNAFDNKLLALHHATLQNNTEQLLPIKHFLAVIKKRLGEDEEALVLFKEYLRLVEQSNADGSIDHDEIIALMSVSDSYRRNKKPDTAMIMAKRGIEMSLRGGFTTFYNICLLSSGMIHYDMGNYPAAIDSLDKAMAFLETSEEKTNLALSYLYLGKSYENLGKPEITIGYFTKTDSILKRYPKVFFEFREGYEYLIDHYKSVGDKDLQLYFVERLLHIDSILDSNYKYLSKNIVQKYDTPTLMAEKKALIDVLYKKNRLSFSGIIVLGVLLVLAFVFAYYYYRKQRMLKKRFDEIMNTHNEPGTVLPPERESEDRKEDLGVSEEVARHILERLSDFVKKQQYLDQEVNLHALAKKLQTNPKYLSKTINYYEQKNFTSYINDLRINYAVNRLKTDRKLQRYAVKAIADETGFSNQQSFSQAFHKKTGMHPSYFIKQLQKHSYN